MKTALFTGTFNPFTIGHADIVERALKIFDKIVIGIGYNPDKETKDSFLSPEIEARVTQIRKVYENDPRVVVEAYSDLTVDLAKRHNAVAIVKGVRSAGFILGDEGSGACLGKLFVAKRVKCKG